MHILNSLFPKVDNLEYFPLKVLSQVFTLVDDIGLVNMAKNGSRFEGIAKIVLNATLTNISLLIYQNTANKRIKIFFDFLTAKLKQSKRNEGKRNSIGSHGYYMQQKIFEN